MKEIQIKFGDLFSVEQGIIVHGCNAQGVMGSGVARQVKVKYPKAYRDYRGEYEKYGLHLGDCIVTEIDSDMKIVSGITQNTYGRTSMRYANYEAIANVFEFIRNLAKHENKQVHFPMIGAGLANGNWNIIKTIIEETCPDVEKFLWINDKELFDMIAPLVIPPKYIGEFKLEENAS